MRRIGNTKSHESQVPTGSRREKALALEPLELQSTSPHWLSHTHILTHKKGLYVLYANSITSSYLQMGLCAALRQKATFICPQKVDGKAHEKRAHIPTPPNVLCGEKEAVLTNKRRTFVVTTRETGETRGDYTDVR